MHTAPIPINDDERLLALGEYGFGPDPADGSIEPIVQLASRMFDVPMAVVNLIARDHVFFAAAVGLDDIDSSLTGRDISFCAHAIAEPETMVVPDATLDPRFHDNPLVVGDASFRFYAGVPLISPAGHALGALCIIDKRARPAFSESDRMQLEELARIVLDKLELRRLNTASRVSQARFRNIAATSPDSIICVDEGGFITDWNSAAERMFGYSAAEAVGQSIDLIVPEELRGRMQRDRLTALTGEATPLRDKPTEMLGLRKDGTVFPAELSASLWSEDGTTGFGAIVRDLSERRRSEDAMYRLAHYDQLTGLANRGVARQRVTEEVGAKRPVAVLAIDLDGFKDINETLGAAVGDAMLREVSQRLQACVRPVDTVCRIGSDEFVLLLPEIGDPLRAADMADAVMQALMQPFQFEGGHEVHITASVGIALHPAHGEGADELLASADMALVQAKGEGRGCKRLFAPHLREAARARRTYDVELRRAAQNGEFTLFYQPQIRLADDTLVGAEALIRWQHPERGLISPAAFVPVLEGGLLAATVGEWVLDTACAQAAEWRLAGAADFRMGINLFGAQFRADDLVQKVTEALDRHHLPPNSLELEITETIVLDQDEAALKPLRVLRDMGVGIAFDDYGTGYASLSLLKRFPLTRLKIDQSFVRNMCESEADAALSRAILYLGRSFQLEVIAEGIETPAQRDLLKRHGCQEGQGFLFGRPAPAENFAVDFGLSRRVVRRAN